LPSASADGDLNITIYSSREYIKEPENDNFFVEAKPLPEKDKREISEIITYYLSYSAGSVK
jgi:hypothetical protein